MDSKLANLVDELSGLVVELGDQDLWSVNGQSHTRYSHAELMAVYDITGEVYTGFMFEALGRDFIIDPDGNILTPQSDSDTETEFFEVEEGVLMDSLENFIEWRLATLRELGV